MEKGKDHKGVWLVPVGHPDSSCLGPLDLPPPLSTGPRKGEELEEEWAPVEKISEWGWGRDRTITSSRPYTKQNCSWGRVGSEEGLG